MKLKVELNTSFRLIRSQYFDLPLACSNIRMERLATRDLAASRNVPLSSSHFRLLQMLSFLKFLHHQAKLFASIARILLPYDRCYSLCILRGANFLDEASY